MFQNGHGRPWFHVAASLQCKLVVEQLYTDVQLLNSLFQKAYGKCAATSCRTQINPRRIKTDTDGESCYI